MNVLCLFLLIMAMTIQSTMATTTPSPSSPTITTNTNNNNNERCVALRSCVRCTNAEKQSEKTGVNLACANNGYHQLVQCTVSGSKNVTRTYYQTCDPEVFYTDRSTTVFLLFQAVLLVLIVVVGFFFYRRKTTLFNEAQQRYTRLTSGRQD